MTICQVHDAPSTHPLPAASASEAGAGGMASAATANRCSRSTTISCASISLARALQHRPSRGVTHHYTIAHPLQGSLCRLHRQAATLPCGLTPTWLLPPDTAPSPLDHASRYGWTGLAGPSTTAQTLDAAHCIKMAMVVKCKHLVHFRTMLLLITFARENECSIMS